MNDDTKQTDIGAPHLDPKSPGCWIPGLIGLTLLVLAYFGVQRVVDSTGPWAIDAARNAVAESGLTDADRAAVLVEVQRLEDALQAGTIDARATTVGVRGVLKDPLIPQLALEDLRTRRVPASGLSDEDKAAADAKLRELASLFEAKKVEFPDFRKVLGSLIEAEEGAPAAPLGDEELKSMLERASEAIAAAYEQHEYLSSRAPEPLPPIELVPVDRAFVLERLAKHVDGVVAPEDAQ